MVYQRKQLFIAIIIGICSCNKGKGNKTEEHSQNIVIQKSAICCQSNIPSRFGINTLPSASKTDTAINKQSR